MPVRRAASATLLCLAAALPARAAGDSLDVRMSFAEDPPPALHPSAISGTYEGKLLRVVGAKGARPLVERDGKRVPLPDGTSFQVDRVGGFLPGSLEVKTQSAESSQTEMVLRLPNGTEVSGGIAREGSTYQARVVASRAYPDCFVALMFFDVGYLDGMTNAPGFVLAFQGIGDLAAGAETRVSADFGFIDFRKHKRFYIPMYFSRGVEIRTNFADDEARLYRRVEMLRHEKALDAYRRHNPKASLDAAPYYRFSPVFTDDLDPATVPDVVRVAFAVTPDGTVEDVSLADRVPKGVDLAVRRALGGWLYMPRLVNGLPYRTNVEMFLRFPRPKAAAPAGSPAAKGG